MTSHFAKMMSSSTFFDIALFLLSSLITGPIFMSISSLVLELWQFSFIRDWPEIRKPEIPLCEFCPISGDWSELGISNISNEMLLNAAEWKVINFTVSELSIRESQKNQLGRGVKFLPTQIRVKSFSLSIKIAHTRF